MTMKQVRVGIVGFGTVGRATADIITKHADLIAQRSGVRLVVSAVCRRSGVQPADVPSEARPLSDWRELLKDPNVDVVVETIGGMGESLQLLRAALEQGKPVVTANKNLLAEHGDELFRLAAARNLPIGFEASVGGGIPVIKAVLCLPRCDKRFVQSAMYADRRRVGTAHFAPGLGPRSMFAAYVLTITDGR